eukprot:37315_1
MNALLAPTGEPSSALEYGSISLRRQKEEQSRHIRRTRCSKKKSVLLTLLTCGILAIGMFVWFEFIIKRHYSNVMKAEENGIFGEGGLGALLLNEDNIDYKTISNADWKKLWLNIGYDPQMIDVIDFHTYAMLGVNYQEIYRELMETMNDDNDNEDDSQLPSLEDCGCNYCLGFCEKIYCSICVH